jgi:hypothetical protein
MKLRELVLAFREEIDDLGGDVADPCAWENDDTGLLWKNHELVRYINEAEREFCRRRPLQDNATAAVCEIAVTSGTAVYAYDERALYIERAKLDGEDYDLEKVLVEYLDEYYPAWESDTGTPLLYVEDMTEHRFRLYPTPDASFTLTLTVGRLPLREMDWNKRLTEEPEINPRHHLDLLLWMGHMAMRKRDSQTYNKEESDRYFDMFESAVGPRVNAHSEKRRRLSRNLPRRTKSYYR